MEDDSANGLETSGDSGDPDNMGGQPLTSDTEAGPGFAPGTSFRRRRRLLRDAAALVCGAAVGGFGYAAAVGGDESRRAASAATVDGDRPDGNTGRGLITMTWEVATDQPLVALTFDDGPRANWTDLVLRTLERHQVPATFFMVGRRVRDHAAVVRDRLGAHEVGNHTWDHTDLGTRTYHQARHDLIRAHETIEDVLGVTPRLVRPPYGHTGGTAALAAAELRYQMVFWSLKMHEAHYDTRQQVAAIVRDTTPGSIVLAHDVGGRDRLVSLRGLPDMIMRLRDRGFQFVTVSQLLARVPAAG